MSPLTRKFSRSFVLIAATILSLLISLTVSAIVPSAEASTSGQQACLQPPAGQDLTKLTPHQLALYGLPQYVKGESRTQWVNALQHATHRICTMKNTTLTHLRQPGKNNSSSTSKNWSGYEPNGDGGYPFAEFTWTVPCIASGSPSGDSSVWVGLGGDGNKNLVQTGSEQAVSYFLGIPFYTYQVWVENLADPNNPNEQVVFGVNCGDSMYAYVFIPNLMYIQDVTTGNYSFQAFGPAANTSTAEFIVERPTQGNGTLYPLDDFQSVTAQGCYVVSNNLGLLRLDQTTYNQITMVNSDGSANLDSISSVNGGLDGFTATWLQAS